MNNSLSDDDDVVVVVNKRINDKTTKGQNVPAEDDSDEDIKVLKRGNDAKKQQDISPISDDDDDEGIKFVKPVRPSSASSAPLHSSSDNHTGKQPNNKKNSSSSSSSHKKRLMSARRNEKNKKRKRKIKDSLQGANGGYAWEDTIKRPWDIVEEEDDYDAILAAKIVELRRKRTSIQITPYQRGIIRTMVMAIDYSEVMAEKDLRPNRVALTIQYLIEFIHEFFDQNPISQLGVITMKNGLANVLSPISGNPQDHLDILHNFKKNLEPKGYPSLQNALELARGLLVNAPSHSTREVLMVFGSLSSTDPGDIHQTIKSLVQDKVRVKIIGLTAQVSICKEICQQTNYNDTSFYSIILNEQHFKNLFTEAVTPLPMNKLNKSFTLVKMGFPTRMIEETPSFCVCHSKLNHGGYFCPNCKSKVCSLPMVCPCCDLMLILSTHLARSYHHLMPLQTFQEVSTSETFPTVKCFSCHKQFPIFKNKKTGELLTSSRYRCTECKRDFCIDCDVFIHEILHNCPGCESKTTL
ncbi:related to Suppressor of stem-loop protein 1 [Saccharomycodes ludwigii]|uniref:Related to Suppressor of stem-loop protein 1 n=1 Tax=Saccharomycodes ludwigii TaxID=36035 RepID=A0A376B7W1_9ASCO|nr:hypothetical protein SCDLUD_004550 [Saccharomycodes ludwigii]KAH3899124.1 hypothetical protein SCDLUD_004550 [Saccharomycodes ludwigii]SSD60763.1 related to Suppressor of stem-loop protein 1 [Saccharomycodes ludwigii]